MFDRLSEGFSSAIRRVSGKSQITEANVRESLSDVRAALLDADVHQDVVDIFIDEVTQDALGEKVLKAVNPGEQMIAIVHKALVELIGGRPEDQPAPGIPKVSPGPTVIMMSGLQGSGKTTTCGKLAAYLVKRGRSVMLAAADLQRPAAVEQLQTVAEQVKTMPGAGAGVHFYSEPDKVAAYGKAVGVAVDVAMRALKEARKQGIDTLIVDTAGRLHVNDSLMGELRAVHKILQPHQTLLVTDAMTGQDAVNSAQQFHAQLHVDGVILTKFDSDTRGGAALTVRSITGAPIKFIGVGEHLDQLEEFHAERIAGRILGMGDVVSLVEKAQTEVSEEEAERIAEKMQKGELTMDDFLSQMKTLRRMGPMKQLLGMLPGVGGMLKDVEIDEKQLDRVEGMVKSMTPAERKDVKLLNMSRRRRIAQGSGTKPDDVGKLTKQFDVISKMSKQMSSMGMKGKLKAMKDLQAAGGGALPGMGGMPALPGLGGGKKGTATRGVKSGFKKRKRR
ncbi:MAG: signal recognition particle protein [Phycisphaerales bacterium]|nr:signal recognition particle protein [Phycisphaerales bacterium]